jgi:hypothetical protein
VPMRATTVRFSDDLWALLEAEASDQGISAAQMVRDATIMRLGVLSARREDDAAKLTLQEIAAGALAGRPRAGGAERLAELRRTGLLDSPREETYDRITRLAARVLEAPVALISLVDEDRQFFKSSLGVDERETPLSHSFCQHAIAQRTPLVVDDAREHPILKDNPAVAEMGSVAYAGVPLIDAAGQALGTLCVIDKRPRQWSSHQVELLSDLAASVVSEIALVSSKA